MMRVKFYISVVMIVWYSILIALVDFAGWVVAAFRKEDNWKAMLVLLIALVIYAVAMVAWTMTWKRPPF